MSNEPDSTFIDSRQASRVPNHQNNTAIKGAAWSIEKCMHAWEGILTAHLPNEVIGRQNIDCIVLQATNKRSVDNL